VPYEYVIDDFNFSVMNVTLLVCAPVAFVFSHRDVFLSSSPYAFGSVTSFIELTLRVRLAMRCEL